MRWMSLLVLLTGCGGVGQVWVTAWGEEFIEQEIPSTVFADGHTVRYSKFLVVIRDFVLGKKTGERGASQSTPFVVDVARPGPTTLLEFEGVDALKYDQVSYRIGPADDAVGVGEVSEADLESMRGHSLRVEGTVTNGAVSKRFAWTFSKSTHYVDCSNLDYGEGVTVPSGARETVQLTMHGDHLWYDGLSADDAQVRGAAIIAADANDDGEVSQAELEAVQLTSLPLDQYDTTSAAGVKTLADFLETLSRTVGHFRGEGDCTATSR